MSILGLRRDVLRSTQYSESPVEFVGVVREALWSSFLPNANTDWLFSQHTLLVKIEWPEYLHSTSCVCIQIRLTSDLEREAAASRTVCDVEVVAHRQAPHSASNAGRDALPPQVSHPSGCAPVGS